MGLLVGWSGGALAGSLSIQPLRQSLTLAPGEAVQKTIAVENSGDQPATATIGAEAFGVTDEQYDYKLDASSSLVKWVVIPVKSVELAPKQQHVFNYTINAPVGTEPGGRYITVIASLSSQTTQGVQSINRAASLLYINVSGHTTSTGRLIDINAPWLATKPNVSLALRVQNGGDTHFRSRQTIDATNLLGRPMDQHIATPLILPDTIRLTEPSVKLGTWPGVYRLSTKIGLGDNPGAIRQLWVLYLPPTQTAVVVFVTLIAVSLVAHEFRQWRRH